MNISKVAADIVRPDVTSKVQGFPASHAGAEAVAPARSADAVLLSEAGLALAGDGAPTQKATSIDPARAEQIRSKILSGAYNSLGMADQVARAVIRSGDI